MKTSEEAGALIQLGGDEGWNQAVGHGGRGGGGRGGGGGEEVGGEEEKDMKREIGRASCRGRV